MTVVFSKPVEEDDVCRPCAPDLSAYVHTRAKRPKRSRYTPYWETLFDVDVEKWKPAWCYAAGDCEGCACAPGQLVTEEEEEPLLGHVGPGEEEPLTKREHRRVMERVLQAEVNRPRYELMRVLGKAEGPHGPKDIPFLVDSGASQDFVSWNVVRELGLRPTKGPELNVQLADGSRVDSSFEVELTTTFRGDPLPVTEKRRFRVLNLGNLKAILGQPWLVDHNPHINFVRQTAVLTVPGQGLTRLRSVKATIVREGDVPAANVISHDELAEMMDRGDGQALVAWVGANREAMQEAHGRESFVFTTGRPGARTKRTASRRRKKRGKRHRRPEGEGKTPEERSPGYDFRLAALDGAHGLGAEEDPGNALHVFATEVTEVADIGTPEGDSATEEEIDEALASEFGGGETARAQIRKFLVEHPGVTSKKGNLTMSRVVDNQEVAHRIVELPNTRPPSRPAFRMSAQEIETLKKQLDVLLANGFIRPSSSPYGAPVMFVPKPDGSLRFVIDYRALNAQTVKDTYNLPRDQDLFDVLELHQAKIMSSVDLIFGYWQVHMHRDDIRKTAIRTPVGSYEFLVMPMGLCNAPATFQRMMEAVLRPFLTKFAMVYLDDIIIFSKTPEEHLDHILQVLHALDKHHLRIKLSKCEFFKTEMLFLGHRIIMKDHGVELKANPEKVRKLREWEEPRSSKDVERFLGLANYYSRMIKGYAGIAAPLMNLTGKSLTGDGFAAQWGADQQRAFETLKESLTSEPVVTLAKPNRTMIIQTDASGVALGGTLMQADDEGHRRVVCYFSHKFSEPEKNWTVNERELYGLVYALRKFRHYLVGTPIKYENDHKPLEWLKTQANLSRRQMRWLETLESFDWEFSYIPGKDLPADTLSRPPEALPEAGDFLTYLALRWANNPDGAAPNDPLLDTVMFADAAGSAGDSDPFERDVTLVNTGSPSLGGKMFTSSRLRHLLHEAYRADDKYAAILDGRTADPRLSARDGIIYVAPALPDLFHAVAVPPKAKELQQLILREYHDVATGAHLGARKMYERVRRHFQWPTLVKDVKRYVNSCHACRTSKRRTHKPPGHPVGYNVPSAPFEHIALDFKTGLPASLRGNDAFIVIVDKLTRYGTIVPYASRRISGDATNVRADAGQVIDIIFDHVVRRWGMPKTISSDRGPQFTSHLWEELWRRTGTSPNLTTAYRPQGDGSSERFIQTISGLLRAQVATMEDARSWDTAVGAIEFAYNDSVHSATGFTPFQLAIGRDPLLPVSVLLHATSPDASLYGQSHLDPRQYLARYARNLATARATLQQVTHAQRESLMHNSSRQVVYRPGDFAYVKTTPPMQLRTLNPRREGPFKVVERTGLNTYRLELGGDNRRHPVFNESELLPYVDRRTGLMYPQESRSPMFVAQEWRDRLARQAGGETEKSALWHELEWRQSNSAALLAELHEPGGDQREDPKRPRILELCAGPNKPAAKALRRRYPKATVVTVDIDPSTCPDIIADLVTWTSTNLPWPPGYFDVIWASPPCTQYSFAKSIGVRYIDEANAIVQAVLRIIETLRPRAWFMENPRGYLRDQPFMQPYNRYLRECTYCRYGAPYRKRTDIWSNVPSVRLEHCDITPCWMKRSKGKHDQTAQGGSTKDGTPGTPRHRAYEPPTALMDYLMGEALVCCGWAPYDRRRIRADWQLSPVFHRKLLRPFTPRRIKVADGWTELFSSDGNHLCNRHWTPQDDAFSRTWSTGRFYGNPVYTNRFITRTLEKALADFETDPSRTTTVLIIPQWTNAPWFPLTKRFRTLQTWEAGTYLFTCPTWYVHGQPRQPVADAPGRYFIGGTPWPVMAIGLGIGPRPHPGR